MYKKINLLRDPIWPLLRKVTVPASIGSLFQTFYNLVDTWFAGRISAEAIGAIAKSFPIYFTIIACLLYTSPSPRDVRSSRMPSSA